MANLTNYHSHTTYCDGKASAETFILEAINKGFYSYGISSHAPLPYHTHWSMNMEDVDSYIKEIDFLKNKYKDMIQIYSGLEIDYLTAGHNPSIPFFKNLPLDYRIGSVHLIENDSNELVDIDVKSETFCEFMNIHFHNDIKIVVKKYFEKIMTMISLGGIDFLGHPDKISMNASFYDPNLFSYKWYKDIINDYFNFIAEKNLMIEINTKAYKTRGFLFPNIDNLHLIHNLGIKVIVNSDSHYPENINDGRKEALEILYSTGFKTVMEIDNNRWTEKEIIL
ncbi:MAG: histidinol-phosphatase [Bacteroidales bacterium]|nr:histidinol-phosphatase [Bacteroidales bacterium]